MKSEILLFLLGLGAFVLGLIINKIHQNLRKRRRFERLWELFINQYPDPEDVDQFNNAYERENFFRRYSRNKR